MKRLILFDKDGKPSMLYAEDCGCEPPKKEKNFPKWLGTLLIEFAKGLIHTLLI
jgi:hypothetical protein